MRELIPSILSDSELDRLERSFYRCLTSDDVTALASLVSDDLRYIHSTGVSQDKKAYLDQLRERRGMFKKVESVETTIRSYPGVTVASSVVETTVERDGKPLVTRQLVVYVWVEEPQGWRLSFRQGTALPTSMP